MYDAARWFLLCPPLVGFLFVLPLFVPSTIGDVPPPLGVLAWRQDKHNERSPSAAH